MTEVPAPTGSMLSPSTSRDTLLINADEDVVAVRQAVRRVAVEAGLQLVEQTMVVTAASELARNALEHGGGGEARVDLVTRSDGKRGVRLTVSDSGPGIPDVSLALTDGYSTRSGMGLGLGGTRRLVDAFDLVSSPGAGTSVTVTRWAP